MRLTDTLYFSEVKHWTENFFNCLDLFRLKYDDKWLHTYELAKASLNNRGNEIRSNERRSNDLREGFLANRDELAESQDQQENFTADE